MIDLGVGGKRAFVTGGSRGIGAAVALRLAEAGADVCIGYRSREGEAAECARRIREHGVRGCAVRGDAADPDGAERQVDGAVDALGGLDILVANAGVWPPEDVPLADLPLTRWRRTLAVNLDGVFATTRAAVRAMAPGGRIVLIGSTAGQRGEAGHADYAASKAALAGLVKSLAVELAPAATTVNCVAPGWVDTEMCEEAFAYGGRERIAATIPLGRVATADDIAGPVLFLCSALASHITGTTVSVNGGAVL